MTNENRLQKNVRLPADLLAGIVTLAQLGNLTHTEIIEASLREYLKKHRQDRKSVV